MNLKKILYTIGNLLKVESIMLLLPLLISFIYQEQFKNQLAFIIPIVSLFLLGTIFTIKKPKKSELYSREGFALVGLSWIIMSLFGCLPFLLSGIIPNFVDSLFETVSGFTTTGATIVENVDSWYENYKSLLFWRSFTHWIGGMGVLVFVLAILPQSDGQNIYILRAESTGPQVGKLVSKLRVTARILYLIYFGFTLLQIIFLVFGDMNFFDAVTHSLATAGTGGFGIRGDSLASYSTYSQIVVAIFMLLFGINFNMFYFILIGKVKQVLKSEELKCYLGIVLFSIIAISLNLYYTVNSSYSIFSTALKDAFFQVSSIITTTGFSTTDFSKWPMFSKAILFVLMFIGGCAGSTAGGIKVSRVVILFKSLKREIKKIIHPNIVSNISFEGTRLEEEVVNGVNNYFNMIIFLCLGCLLFVSFDKFDFETTITAVVTCINNVGPGLSSLIGPFGNFSCFSYLSKIVLIFAMLVGRLEIYPMLVIFSPKAWKNK